MLHLCAKKPTPDGLYKGGRARTAVASVLRNNAAMPCINVFLKRFRMPISRGVNKSQPFRINDSGRRRRFAEVCAQIPDIPKLDHEQGQSVDCIRDRLTKCIHVQIYGY